MPAGIIFTYINDYLLLLLYSFTNKNKLEKKEKENFLYVNELRWPTLFFSENSLLENFLILKQCIIQLHNFRKK